MPVPIISVAQMRQWEQDSWRDGVSQQEVILRVGQEVAERALSLTGRGDPILILAGKGHNGDDARCALPWLKERKCTLLNVLEPRSVLQELSTQSAYKLIIDGIFGIGLNRPLDEAWNDLFERLNQLAVPILSVDVPSGLNAETGEPMGTSLCASVTLTVGAVKAGLLKPSAVPFVGRLEVAPAIGLKPVTLQSELQWSVSADFRGFPPMRKIEGHKGSFGHVGILAGSVGYHGAAVLAARGALRAMPGLVSVFCHPDVYVPVASQTQAAMVHPWSPGVPLPEGLSALVAGPGLASPKLDESWGGFLNEQWQTFPLPVIVDASALNWLRPGATPLNSRRVITPHPGEAARILGTKASVVQENRVSVLRELSSRFGNCWVVLKGHQTLIGRSTGEVFLNSTGNPFLAQGGSGDVLAGYLGGLLAQPKLQAHPLKTIRYAVWQHGAVADKLTNSQQTWTIEELLQHLGSVSPD